MLPFALALPVAATMPNLWHGREMYPRMTSELVGPGEALVAAGVCANVRLFAGVCADMPGLQSARPTSSAGGRDRQVEESTEEEK